MAYKPSKKEDWEKAMDKLDKLPAKKRAAEKKKALPPKKK